MHCYKINFKILQTVQKYFNDKNQIKLELIKTKSLLDNVLEYSLDKSQRIAVLTDNASTLIVAPAGSGKTLTIVGKIRYLIEYKNINQNEILCLSFTRKSAENLKEKLSFNYNYKIDVYTFHSLALEIVKTNSVNICNSNLLEYIIEEYFNIVENKEIVDYIKSCDSRVLKKTISTFIRRFKCNNYNAFLFLEIVNKNNYIIIMIIISIYKLYQDELKSTNSVDFDDLITVAIEEVKNKRDLKKYKYIIIDEYQDTSIIRFLLVYSIMKKTNAKLMAVGDDWQSIYKFSGCDINLFLKFNKFFKNGKILYIKNTYRNSKQLIEVSSRFILRNSKQIKKQIKSNKELDKPIKFINDKKNILIKLLNYLHNMGMKNVLILGRNNQDIYKYIEKNFINNQGKIIYKDMNITYLTVHKSKGLEEENVILINLHDDIIGFPCKLEDNSIIKLIDKECDRYKYSEERRLFYVALTRTKNNVFCIIPKEKSIFVSEIERYGKQYIEYLSI